MQGVNSFVRESRRVVNRQVFKLQDTVDAILARKCDFHMRGTKIQNETLNEMVAGLWRIRDLEEYNMFIFIKVLVVFTKNAHIVSFYRSNLK